MKALISLFALLALAACAPRLDMGLAYLDADAAEYPQAAAAGGPIGIVRVSNAVHDAFGARVFCEHLSSVPDRDGTGLNLCGLTLSFGAGGG